MFVGFFVTGFVAGLISFELTGVLAFASDDPTTSGISIADIVIAGVLDVGVLAIIVQAPEAGRTSHRRPSSQEETGLRRCYQEEEAAGRLVGVGALAKISSAHRLLGAIGR